MRKFLLKISGLIAMLVIWQSVFSIGLLKKTLFPSPAETFEVLIQLLVSGNILPDLGDTMWRMISGYCLAVVVGVLIGLVTGLSKSLYESLEGIIDFFRSIPVTALYPVFVLLFGILNTSKIAMIFWASIFVIILNTAYGVIQSNKIRHEVAHLYGANADFGDPRPAISAIPVHIFVA